jgi:pyruvate/2-oxoglutarate dehydrogenase complex dihydrolipoamide acyltransferase (E2) component
VQKGDPIAEIETDKATFTIEADEKGYILGFVPPLGELVAVGSVLAWMGSSREEVVPLVDQSPAVKAMHDEPTLKATILLAKFGLSASDVRTAGDRLTAQEVLDFVQQRNLQALTQRGSVEPETSPLLAPGETVTLSVPERAMLKSVLWQRDSAVPGYVEIEYETRAWDEHAIAYQHEHNMFLSPLLALMAYRLVQLAREHAKLNSTILGDKLHQYSVANLGFTLQSETRLSLLCVKDAASLSRKEFVDRLGSLMRRGMKDKLMPDETTEITISFSSMSRWQVSRHIPVLPPYTSLIVSHAYARNGMAALGGAYDHRVLAGGDVAVALRCLSRPSNET